MKKALFFLMTLMALTCLPWAVNGQQTITSFPFNCGFEDADDANLWQFANDATNAWVIGTAKFKDGEKGLYISNNGGTSYARSNTKMSSYAYVTMTLSAAAEYELSFNWTANGESNYDYIRVFLAPANATLTAGTFPDGTAIGSYSTISANISVTPSGWLNLSDGKLNQQTSWQTKSKSFSVSEDGDYKLIFMWIQDDGTNDPGAIDNVVVNAYSCKPVTIGNTTNVTATSARINWTIPAGQSASYMIRNGENLMATTTEGATYYDLPLSPNTTYNNLTVTADCGSDGASAAVAVPSFKTLCNPTGLPYGIEGFDEMTVGNVPDCWTVVTGNCNVYNYYSHSASNVVRLYNGTNIVVMPAPISVEANTTQVEFYARIMYNSYSSYYSYNGNLQVGYLTDASDASSFVPVRTLAYGDYISYPESAIKVPMTMAPDGAVIAFRCQPTSTSTSYGWYIDDVTIDEAPNCLLVSVDPVTATSTTSATFSWTDGNSGTPTYTVKMGNTELDGNSTPAVSVTGTTATLTGLTAEHNYAAGDFKIIANCGENDHSEPANVPAFYTGYCQPAGSNIDNKGITAVSFGSGDGTTVNNSNASGLTTSSPYYGNFSNMVGAVYAGTTANVSITLATGYTYVTVIWVDWNNNLTFEDNEIVYAGEDAGTNPITFTAPINIDANQVIGDYRMRIASADSYYNDHKTMETAAGADPCPTTGYIQIHDYTLRVTEAPSCMPPTALSLSRNGNLITATWDGTGNDYNIDINGTVTENVTTPYVFNAELSTTYTVRVQANCGNETSEWTNTQSITTPACWGGHTIEYTLTDQYDDSWNGASISVVEGCGTIVETLTCANGASPFNGTLNLCGDYYQFIWNSGNYDSECSFTFTEGETTLFTKPSNVSDGAVLYTIGTITCPIPTALNNQEPEARNVDLSWTENGDAEAWQICVNDDMDNLVNVAAADLNNGSYTLGNLDTETSYAVKVRAVCGENDFSCWTEKIYFTTDVACPAPSNANVGTPAPNQVELSWTKNGEETAWQLRVNGDMDHLIDVTAGVNINPEDNYATVENGTVTYTLTNLSASTSYTVVVRANCEVSSTGDGQSEWLSFDDFTTAASCPTPVFESTGITGITGHTANVAWNGFDENDSYVVHYRVKEHIDGTVENFDENSIPTGWELKQGLLSNVMAGTVTLTTASYGWSFGSENGVFNNHARTEIYGTSKKHWLITPSKTLTSNAALNFDLALTYWSGTLGTPATTGTDDKFVVLITTDDGATWTILRQWDNEDGSTYVYNNITCSATGEHVSIDLSAYNGETVKVAFYGESTTSNADNYLHIDNVTMGTLVPAGSWLTKDVTAPETSTILDNLDPLTPYEVYVTGHCTTGDVTTDPSAIQTFTTTVACPAPTALTFESATTNTATVNWNSPLNAWIVAYKAETDNSYTEESTTDNPFTIPNLAPANNYTVKVKADCSANNDGESEWSNEISFHTDCPDNFPLDYTCGFEGPNTTGSNIMPLCWTRMNTSTSYPYVLNNSSNAHNGTYSLYFYKSSSSNYSNEIAALPAIDADLNTVRIAFYGKLSSTSTDGTINVGYVTDLDDATTFTSVQTVTLTTGYEKYTVSFGNVNPETSGYIALQSLYNTATAYIYIDDITVEPIPSCIEPSELQFVSSTTTTATLQWIAGGSETAWDIYYSTENVAPTSSTTPLVSATSDNPATVPNLTASTKYYAWVRTHCGDNDQSEWVGGISFTTPCDAQPITYTFGFEADEAGKFDCWTPISGTIALQTNNAHNGTQYLDFRGTTSNMVALPAFNEPTNTLRVEFWTRPESKSTPTSTYNYSGKFAVGYMTDISDVNTFVAVETYNNTDWAESLVYVKKTVDMIGVPANATIAMRQYDCATNYFWYVDDITVKLIPSCEVVSGLTVGEKTANSVALSWTPGSSQETNWKLQYRMDGTQDWNTVDVAATDLNEGVYTLDQLSAETTYNWQVAANCGNNDISEYIAGANFTTEAIPEFTVTFVAGNSGTCNTTELTGSSITLPEAAPSDICVVNGWSFAGWSTEAVNTNTTTAPEHLYTAGSTYEPTAPTTLYAVYRTGQAEDPTWEKATSIAVGDVVVLVAETSNVTKELDGFNTSGSNPYGIATDYTTAPVATYPLAVVEGNATSSFAFKTSDNKYLSWTSGNSLTTATSVSNASSWTVVFDGYNAEVSNVGTSARKLQYNAGSPRFACYSNSSQTDVQLYKQLPGGTIYTYNSDPACPYTITVNTVVGGTIETNPENEALAGATVTMTATPAEGYDFTSWDVTSGSTSVDVTGNSFIMPEGNVTVSATFTKKSYTITVTANPTAGGTVTESGSYEHGTTVTLNATANSDYDFLGWYVNGESVTDETEYTFTAVSDSSFEARFAQRFVVTFDAGEMGTPGETSLTGSSITLPEATPSDVCIANGWSFAGWSAAQVGEATEAPAGLLLAGTTYLPTAPTTLYAVYKQGGPQETVFNIGNIASENGWYNGTQYLTITLGTVTLTATGGGSTGKYYTSDKTWRFYSSESGTLTVTSTNNDVIAVSATSTPSASFTISGGAATFTAVPVGQFTNTFFTEITVTTGSATVTYTSNPACVILYHVYTSNNTSANGSFDINPNEAAEGVTITLTPNVDAHYHLTGWNFEDAQGGSVTVTVNPDNNTFVMPAFDVFVAMQTAIDQFTIAATADPAAGGTVNGAGTYDYGTEITLTATANEGYTFVNWTKGGEPVSTNPTCTLAVTEAAAYVANFELNSYDITSSSIATTLPFLPTRPRVVP